MGLIIGLRQKVWLSSDSLARSKQMKFQVTWTPVRSLSRRRFAKQRKKLGEAYQPIKFIEPRALFSSFFFCCRYDEHDLRIYTNISKTLEYRVKTWDKIVIYWLAEVVDVTKAPTVSEEHEDLRWLSKDDAIRIAGYNDFAELLEEFHEKYIEMTEKEEADEEEWRGFL